MSNTFKWDKQGLAMIDRAITKGLLNIGAAIAKQARNNAPVDTGALKGSIRIAERDSRHIEVLAGGHAGRFSVPYALRREFENNLHPNKRYYMTNATKTVARGDIKQYFKGLIK